MVDKLDTVDLLSGVDGDTGLWLTLAEIARRRGTSRQAVSKRVKKLGLATRQGVNGTVLIELAAFDRATHQATIRPDLAARPAAPRARRGSSGDTPMAERTRYEAALRRLDLEERLKNLVSTKHVEDAMVAAGAVIVRVFGRLTAASSDIYAVTQQGGEPAVRRLLRGLADEMRRDAGLALAELARQGEAEEAAGGVEFDFPSLTEERMP